MVYSQNEKNYFLCFHLRADPFQKGFDVQDSKLGVTSFVNNDKNLTGVSIHLKDIAKTRPEVVPLTKALIVPT